MSKKAKEPEVVGSVEELTKEHEKIQQDLDELKKRERKVRQALLRAATAHLSPRPKRFSVGGWDCDLSPIKLCVYNPDDDEDEACGGGCCLFCEEPDERQ